MGGILTHWRIEDYRDDEDGIWNIADYALRPEEAAWITAWNEFVQGSGEPTIRPHLSSMIVGAGPVQAYNLDEIVEGALQASKPSMIGRLMNSVIKQCACHRKATV